MDESTKNKIYNFPLNWWQNITIAEILTRQFKKHIVGLLIDGSIKGESQHYLYSGILLEYKGSLLWLTAGHVIDNIDSVLKHPSFKVSTMRWLDDYDTPEAGSIPINYSNLDMRSWTTQNIDFGVINIALLERQCLKANKETIAINSEIWRNLNQASPEGYYIVGYPRAWNNYSEKRLEGNKILKSIWTNIACIPLLPIAPPSNTNDDPFWNSDGAFYGQLINYPDMEDFQIETISGMSGGPIFTIERTPNSQFAYRLAGLQSAWKPESKIIRGTPIDLIEKALDKWLS